MIIVCEPQCKGISHEKFNSGFLFGLRLAFPDDKILFFTDKSHIQAIQKILIYDRISINNIEYVPIKYGNPFSLSGIPKYYLVFSKIFSSALKNGTDKIFFLSYSPLILYLIKKLKQKGKFLKMKFTLVLHGGFENIVNKEDKMSRISLKEEKINHISGIKKIRREGIIELTRKGIRKFKDLVEKPLESFTGRIFREKEMLLWKHSPDFRYIALAGHVQKNAQKYIDVEALNMHTVILPTVFEETAPKPDNEYVKFGIFGFGGSLMSLMLYNIALLLSERSVKNTYEIRIIGMDSKRISGFLNITCPSPDKVLERTDMKKYAKDIDIFLILYGEDRYRVTCSGSILESLSYSKPILHFNNDCINAFNTSQNPIGFCCDSIDEYVSKMQDIIENYKLYVPKLEEFRKNISIVRKECSIENSVNEIKASFTWA